MVGEIIAAIIIGIIAGYLGRLLLPGRDPMGFVQTVAFGVAGALIGYFVFRAIGIGDDDKFDLGSLLGAILGTMLLLAIWRMIAGRSDSGAGRGAGARP